MKKRVSLLLLALLMVTALVGCGEVEKEPEMTDDEKIAYVAKQLNNTSWHGEVTMFKKLSTDFTYTVNFSDDLTFSLYMESYLHGESGVEIDGKCDSVSADIDITGHNFGIEATIDGWEVSFSVLCDESLRICEVGRLHFSKGGISMTSDDSLKKL